MESENSGFVPDMPYGTFSKPWKVVCWVIAFLVTIVLAVAVALWAVPQVDATVNSIVNSASPATVDLPEDRGIEGYVVPEAATPTESTAMTPVNILLLGTDTRGTMDGQSVLQGNSSDMRSDVMILVHVSADRQHVEMVSLMRDLWVTIPGSGANAKLNAALPRGGVPLTVATIEQLVGQRIDHVALIDFAGFKGVIDSLGGVTVNNPTAFKATHMPKGEPDSYFEAGPQRMSGEVALAFVRERYAFINADYRRTANQRLLLQAIFDSFKSADLSQIGVASLRLMPYLTVDNEMDPTTAATLLSDVEQATLDGGLFPTAGTGMEGSQSVVYVDDVRLQAFRAALADDTLNEYVANNRQNW